MLAKLNNLIAAATARNLVLETKTGEDHVDVTWSGGMGQRYDKLNQLQALSDRADTLAALLPDPV